MSKTILFILLTILFVSCNNKRKLLLPQTEVSILTTVENHSPVYIFFDEKSKDSTADVNRKNTISSTHWIFNVDKRLPLKKAIPEIIKLQNKKDGSLHKETTSQNYYSYSNSQKKELAFIPFTKVIYQMKMPNLKTTIVYFTKNNKVVITKQQDTIAKYVEYTKINDIFHQRLTDVTPQINFCFNKDITFNQYLQYQVWLYVNMNKWFVNPNGSTVEYVY